MKPTNLAFVVVHLNIVWMQRGASLHMLSLCVYNNLYGSNTFLSSEIYLEVFLFNAATFVYLKRLGLTCASRKERCLTLRKIFLCVSCLAF